MPCKVDDGSQENKDKKTERKKERKRAWLGGFRRLSSIDGWVGGWEALFNSV